MTIHQLPWEIGYLARLANTRAVREIAFEKALTPYLALVTKERRMYVY
jgi:hypothetical protein